MRKLTRDWGARLRAGAIRHRSNEEAFTLVDAKVIDNEPSAINYEPDEPDESVH